MRRNSVICLLAGFCLVAMAVPACKDKNPADPDPDPDAHVLPPDDADVEDFMVREVRPGHGPTIGGNEVLVLGVGFLDGDRVFFGERMADPGAVVVLDETRIVCLVPPGEVGSVMVKVAHPEGEFAELADGYTYDPFYVDPPAGTKNGGTFVRVIGTGTDFQDGDVVTFNGEALVNQQIVSAAVITGNTPPGDTGAALVRIDGPGGTHQAEAFTYYDGSDPVNGGLGGGPIDGELNITLLDMYTQEPIEGAFVILGANFQTPYQGYTDVQGRITFTDPDLTGPQAVTAAKEGYERLSFVNFDAREVTAYMEPIPEPSPGFPPSIPASVVRGKIRFGGIEPGPDACQMSLLIPDPGPGEERVIRVYQSLYDIDWPPLPLGEDGIVREGEPCDGGFDYQIYTYPSTYAVYAIGGIEDTATGNSTPYAAGFTRGIITQPGQEVEADIAVDLPLDRDLSVELMGPPPLDSSGPAVYRMRLFIDLGTDGFVVREDHVAETFDATPAASFTGLAPLAGTISDGVYAVMGDAYNYGFYPLSQVWVSDIDPDVTSVVQVNDFLGIPEAVDPLQFATVTQGRMTWQASGATPTFNLVMIRTYPDDLPFWRVYLEGSSTSFSVPDFSALGLGSYPDGWMVWHIWSISVTGLNFNNFNYMYLYDRYWRAAAAHAFFFEFPAP